MELSRRQLLELGTAIPIAIKTAPFLPVFDRKEAQETGRNYEKLLAAVPDPRLRSTMEYVIRHFPELELHTFQVQSTHQEYYLDDQGRYYQHSEKNNYPPFKETRIDCSFIKVIAPENGDLIPLQHHLVHNPNIPKENIFSEVGQINSNLSIRLQLSIAPDGDLVAQLSTWDNQINLGVINSNDIPGLLQILPKLLDQKTTAAYLKQRKEAKARLYAEYIAERENNRHFSLWSREYLETQAQWWADTETRVVSSISDVCLFAYLAQGFKTRQEIAKGITETAQAISRVDTIVSFGETIREWSINSRLEKGVRIVRNALQRLRKHSPENPKVLLEHMPELELEIPDEKIAKPMYAEVIKTS